MALTARRDRKSTAASSGHSPSRRAFLRGRPASAPTPHRLPWTTPERVETACTRCGDCVANCPQQIIAFSPSGLPSVSFDNGECTFCGACAKVCPDDVFDRRLTPPWTLLAQVSEACLAQRGITCRSCQDACAERAIRFPPRLGGREVPVLDVDACTGCGACVSVCPVNAIDVV